MRQWNDLEHRMWIKHVDCSWNVMAHGDAREGKWRGNWWMQWVASTLHTTSEHGVSSITTADVHSSAASSQLNWRPQADLNGLVRLAERLNLVSARVPSYFNWPLHPWHSRCQGVWKSLLSVSCAHKARQPEFPAICLFADHSSQSIFGGQVRSCTNILCLFVVFYCVSNR